MKRNEALEELAELVSIVRSNFYYGASPELYFKGKMQEVFQAIGCTPEEIESLDL